MNSSSLFSPVMVKRPINVKPSCTRCKDGFGAMKPEAGIFLNQRLLSYFNLKRYKCLSCLKSRIVYDRYQKHKGMVATPPTNILEYKENYEIQVFVAGLIKSTLEITLNANGTELSIEGRLMHQSQCERYHLIEQKIYRKIKRLFKLPSNIDLQQLEASFKNGLLKIILPKMDMSRNLYVEDKSSLSKKPVERTISFRSKAQI